MRSSSITTISDAILLGAGLGTRLKPFTNLCPKPLIPVLGVPCIDFSFALLKQYGVKNAVVNLHSHPELMQAHLKKFSADFKIQVSDESEQLLGSAGGFRKALSLFNGRTFFGLNADVITRVDLSKLEAKHLELKKKHGVVMTLALLSGKALDALSGSYTEINVNDESGLVTGFGKKEKQVPFYSGVGIFEEEAFSMLSENTVAEFVPEVLDPWIKKNKVGFIKYDDIWMDVGTPELWWSAHHALLSHVNEEPWKKLLSGAKQMGHCRMDLPWKGWIQYGKDATPQNFLGKRGIQLENLIYECKL